MKRVALLGALCVMVSTVSAFADPETPTSASVAPAPAVTTPAPAAPKPAATASLSWLRPDKPMAKPALELEHGPSPLRVLAMLMFVGGLGGAAMYARKKRQVSAKATPTGQLKLLGTTRVGPKATAVVVEVAGKRLLLGVTDQSVSTLAWLDDEANAAVEAREPPSVVERPVSAPRAVDDPVAGASGFLKLLRNAVGTSAARTGAAADEVAKTTQDQVRLSSRRERAPVHDESVAFEGQVMGLAKRRRDAK